MNGKKARALRRAIGAVGSDKELLNGFNAVSFSSRHLGNSNVRVLGTVASAYKNLKKSYRIMSRDSRVRAGLHVTLGNLANTGVFINTQNADALRRQAALLIRMSIASMSIRHMPVGGLNGRIKSK